jgi:hypothetical protein
VPADGDERAAHAERFRLVSTRYPRRVAEAYGGDLARAMADSDEEVAERVRAWEVERGLEPRDWRTIGRVERAEPSD